jgi:hypothetical protein
VQETGAAVRLEVQPPSRLAAYAAALFEQATGENIPTGILHWSLFQPYRITDFDGVGWRAVCDQPTFVQLYLDLQQGQKRDCGLAPVDELQRRAAAYHDASVTPIAIAAFDYVTPKRAFVAKVFAAAEKEEPPPSPADYPLGRILEQRQAFFASALLPDHSHEFELLPHVHDGLAARFVVPRALFFTNLAADVAALEVDLDDGEGYRTIAFDEAMAVTYADELPKTVRLRANVGGTAFEAAFRFVVRRISTPTPNDVWSLRGVQPYTGVTASGTAWVFYGAGHDRLVSPLIFADAFGEGKSNLNDIWNALSAQSLAQQLLDKGHDLVILGYDSKSEYIQANAFLAVACIETALAKSPPETQLNVAGASMGGLVTRYALAWMETQGRRHGTAKYLSFDTPHHGAWVMPILQYFAYYFENKSGDAKRLANLIRSAGARQLLWGWVGAWDYSGPITNNPLRAALYKEFRDNGWFPRTPRKYGVANGTGNGTGNGVPAGGKAVDWSGNPCVGAYLHVAAQPGDQTFSGELWLWPYDSQYYATNVPAFDSAPGGTAEFFGRAGDGARASGHGWTTISYRTTCFVPSVSALSIDKMGTPYVDISTLPAGSSDLDEYIVCDANLSHVTVTAAIASWLLERVG